jgi:RNA polymerase sigma-70 factor (ECF subfamily)
VTAGASATLERAVREDGPRVLATLIRHLGGDFQLAEDALQDAFLAAVVAWPRDGAPTAPAAWLTTTARRKAIDRLRRARSADERVRSLEALTRSQTPARHRTTIRAPSRTTACGCCSRAATRRSRCPPASR